MQIATGYLCKVTTKIQLVLKSKQETRAFFYTASVKGSGANV